MDPYIYLHTNTLINKLDIIPDNLKTGVTKHTSRELVLNPTYKEMADHYGTVIINKITRVKID